MIKIFGKNTNKLFKKNNKPAFSMPQSLKYCPTPIRKCACSHDFVAMIGTHNGLKNSLIFLYGSNFYPIVQGLGQVFDIAVSQNTVGIITLDGKVYVWEFDEEKVIKGICSAQHIKVNLDIEDSLMGIYAGGDDIFLNTEQGKVYHFRRNQWYQTKTFSNIQILQMSSKIVQVSSGPKKNLFLTYDGKIFQSSKEDPLTLYQIKSKQNFIYISTYDYCAAITKKGTIFLWGDSIHGKFDSPTEFAKLTKKFIEVKLERDNGFAISDDGEIWCWGTNMNGQLGLSDYEKRLKPFPLITLQKYKCLDVFCGQSYTVCLCQPNKNKDDQNIKVVNRKISGFEIYRQQSKTSLAAFIKHQNSLQQKNRKTPPLLRTPKNKNSQKRCNKSLSKNNRSATKSPLLKTPKHHVKRNSMVSPKYRKDSKSIPKSKPMNKTKTHQKLIEHNFTLNEAVSEESFKDIKYQITPHMLKQNQQLRNTNTSLLKENQHLHEQIDKQLSENTLLTQKVAQQKQIIDDITIKIRLLEEAIEEYERDLTARDTLVEEQHIKQRQYLAHIDELQKSIDDLVKNKERNQQVTIIYEDIEKNFDKQRKYYINKIKQLEAEAHHNAKNKEQEIQKIIKKLKDGDNKQNVEQQSKLNQKNNYQKLKDVLSLDQQANQWSTPSPILKPRNVDSVPSFNCQNNLVEISNINREFVTPNHTDYQNQEMQRMINKIQSSKSRIKLTADKLLNALDHN